MAARKSRIGSDSGQLMAWIAVPRVFTLPMLVAMGLSVAQFLWRWFDDVKIIAWACGTVSPFCMMCATAVWGMRDRLDEALESDNLKSSGYERLATLAEEHRRRATLWAAFSAMMALVSALPVTSNQLIGPIWHWMVLASGAAVAGSAYAYMLVNHWEYQIREFRHKQRLNAKKAQEQEALAKAVAASPVRSVGTGWVEGPELKTTSR